MTLLLDTVARVSLPIIGTRLPVLANLAQITALAAQDLGRMSAQAARVDTSRTPSTTLQTAHASYAMEVVSFASTATISVTTLIAILLWGTCIALTHLSV